MISNLSTRRQFLKNSAATALAFGFADFGFLSRLPRVSAEEASLPPKVVQFSPEIEPLVRFLEETPRDRLLEEVGARIQRGLSYREVLTALLLAGVRNIQPRPVGFKFHSVLVVNSAHLASVSSPDSDRWLPIFWALDYFKSAQAQDTREGDWTMAPLEKDKLPAARTAAESFEKAMDSWDETAADLAVSGLARTAGANQIFDLLCRYGARDFRDIGHKAIYVANGWRTLQAIGWQHAEPVLRSLAYALLDRGGGPNPAQADLPPDRPWRSNLAAIGKIRSGWLDGEPSRAACLDLLQTLREATPEEASAKVIDLLNSGISPQTIWDALFDGAAELLMRRPGIISLHAVTSTNALHFAYQTCRTEETRQMLLLQNAAFLTLFRGMGDGASSVRLDELQSLSGEGGNTPTLDEIFAEINRDRMAAAGKTLAWLKQNPVPGEFVSAARRFVFQKGTNSHDYKFSSAVLEDYRNISPGWRDRFLAASVFSLRGSGDPDNELVRRARSALEA